ncbi:MAG: (Fe-S)-binding protein [Candidatus Bathyarchaeia archaeon]
MLNLETYRNRLLRCTRCGVCGAKYDYFAGVFRVCPIVDHSPGFEVYYPRGRISVATEILEGNLTYSEGLANVLTACSTCMNCAQQCGSTDAKGDPLINTPRIIEAMRADIVDLGLAPKPYVTLSSRTEKNRNPYGELHEKRTQWAEGLDVPSGKSDIVYFVGCTSSYRRKEIAATTAGVLKKVGIPFSILKDEWCCGSPLRRTGYWKLAEEMARHNVEALKDAKTVITSCAGCTRAFVKDYPEIVGDLPFEALHITEFLETLMDEGKIKLKEPIAKKVTYHDPCHIGRELIIYDPPRNLLNAIPNIEFVEMKSIRENAWCCGGGGGLKISNPNMAVRIATDRLNHAKEVGAEAIVSSCPFCKTNIVDAIKKTESDLKMYDITELVALSMGI